MEPFTVQCSTCQSRIRVRNSSLIGQLVNCPKCQSIVQVTHPAATTGLGSLPVQEEASAQAPVDSKAITRDGIEGQNFTVLPPKSTEIDEYRLLPLDDSASPHGQEPHFSETFQSGALDDRKGSAIAAPPVQWSPTGRASPSQDWTSPTTSRKRQVLLVSSIGLSSLLLTGAVFALFLRRVNQPERTELELASQDAHANQQIEADLATTEFDSDVLVDSLHPQDTTEPSQPISLDSLHPTDSPSSDLSESEQNPLNPEADSTSNLVAGNAQDVAQDEVQGESISDRVASVALPNRLKELAELIGQPFEFSVPQTLAVPDQAPVTAEELGIASTTIDKSLPPVDLHAVANERRMSGLRLDNIPIAHAVNFLSLASGIPVILDANSLLAANLDRRERISLRLDDSTVSEGMHKFAQQSNLQLQSVENRYYRLYSLPPDDQKLPLQLAVNDISPDDASIEWLRSFVDQFFESISDGITLDNDSMGANKDKVDVLSWFVLVRALENWRLHRGLPSAIPHYLPENLLVPFVLPDQAPGLSRPLQRITASPQPFASILTSLCSDCGIECWIDWPSLSALGLSPNTLLSTVTFNRTLKNILQELAFEHGLVTVIVDQNTIWLTNKEAYRHSPDLFVIPSEGRALNYWEQYFRPLTPVLGGGVSKTELILTQDGAYLFVRCCRPTLDFN